MGKYSRVQTPPPRRPWDVHPIWRGIGCLFVLLGPILALAIGHEFVNYNGQYGWINIPRELMYSYTIPIPPISIPKIPVIDLRYTINHFYATLIVGAILLFLGIGLVMIAYSIMYRIVGPSRYGPMDSPPVYRTKASRKR